MILILLIILGLTILYFKENRITLINKKINGPRVLPIFGNLFDLKKKDRDVHDTFDYFYKLYGPIYRMKFGNIETIVLTESLLKKAFTEHSEILIDRFIRSSRAKNTKCLNIGNSNGDYYKKLFSIISPELTPTRLKKYVEPNFKKELIKFCNFIDSKGSSTTTNTTTLNINQYIKSFTLNSMLRLLFSIHFPYDNSINDLYTVDTTTTNQFQSDDHTNSDEIKTLIKSIEFYVLNSGKVVLSDFIPFLSTLLKDKPKSYYQSYEILKKFVSKFVNREMEKVKSNILTTELDSYEPNNISQLLIIQYLKGNIEFEAIVANCIDLLLGGTDTTSNAINFSIIAILNNDNIQDELVSNIKNSLSSSGGSGGADDNDNDNDDDDDIKVLFYSDYKLKIQYLQSIIKETFRRYPLVPIGLQHKVLEDCEIGGYKVAAGTQVFQNIYSSHLSDKIWDNPLKFDPNRFYSSSSNSNNNNNNRLIYQYGLGSRKCIGFNVSDSIIFTFLATIFNRYEISNPNHPIPINDKGIFSLALQPPKFEITFKKR